jgi:hypothetical protein
VESLAVLAALDWAVIGGVGGLIGLAISIVAIFLAGKQSAAAAKRAEEATLAFADWGFDCFLRPCPRSSPMPCLYYPLEIRSRGASVWVHEVKLTWRIEDLWPNESGGGYCAAPHGLPVKLLVGDDFGVPLLWPDSGPEAMGPLSANVWVTWSLTRDGMQEDRTAHIAAVEWQNVEDRDVRVFEPSVEPREAD